MLKHLNPSTVVKPFSRYSQAVEVPANSRWLHVSGQVGATPDGTILKGFEAQAKRCWINIIAMLAASGMGVEDLVKVNIFVTSAEHVGASRTIRDAALKGAEPASTFLVVAPWRTRISSSRSMPWPRRRSGQRQIACGFLRTRGLRARQ